MNTRIVIGGGSGFIGRHLVQRLAAAGYEPVVVSRAPASGEIGWDGDLQSALRGAAGVVNLAGASVGRPWTARRRRDILESRLETTHAIVDAIGRLDESERPRVLISASGIDYAGDTGDEVVTESAEPGSTFLARVCLAWEEAATVAERHGIRVARLRTSFVLGRDAPALRLMALPFRLFAGGRLGSGRQWFPWIHVDDAVDLYLQAIEDERLFGPVNVVAPELVRQRELAEALGSVLQRPALLPAPAFALRLVLGRQADLLLHGQRAVSEKLADHVFRHPTVGAALAEALG